MKLVLKVKPGAKQNRVEKIAENQFKVWVKAPPAEGRANQAVIEILAEYLNLPKSKLEIVQGLSGKSKVVLVKN